MVTLTTCHLDPAPRLSCQEEHTTLHTRLRQVADPLVTRVVPTLTLRNIPTSLRSTRLTFPKITLVILHRQLLGHLLPKAGLDLPQVLQLLGRLLDQAVCLRTM